MMQALDIRGKPAAVELADLHLVVPQPALRCFAFWDNDTPIWDVKSVPILQ
jgi:hypothetical protein